MTNLGNIVPLEIKSVDAKPKENLGSLFNLFSSEYFTLDMAMIYLYKKRAVTGILDFLVNKLYEYNDYDISFYIPQLCYQLLKTHSSTLEKFLMDKCTHNITHFLKILWCLNAFGKAVKTKKEFDYLESLIIKAEMAVVNGAHTKKVIIGSPETRSRRSTNPTPQEFEMMKIEAERKRNRVVYLAETMKFTNILVSISLKLKTIKIEDRQATLKSYVQRINKWLHQMRMKHLTNKDEYFMRLFYGINLPLSSESKDHSTQVVRILDEEIICFNTKKRAPYRIVIETIDMNEIDFIKPKPKGNNPKESGDFTLNIMSTEDEDTWDDLLLESIEEGSVSHSIIRGESPEKENYKELVDFVKIAKKEEAKWKDTGILKKVDLVQKYENQRSKTIWSLPQFLKDMSPVAKKQVTIKFPEENHDLESPSKKYFNNLNVFNQAFPRRKTIERRKSREIEFKKISYLKRSKSLSDLKGKELLHCMERFRDNYLPKHMLEKYDKIIFDVEHEPSRTEPLSKRTGTMHTPSPKKIKKKGWGPWEEIWEYKKTIIRDQSPFGHFKSYKLRCLVVKANDDLRQEVIAMQVMKKIAEIWKEAGLTLALRPYDILVISNNSGILEFVKDTLSLDTIKKKNPGKSLLQFFVDTFEFNFEEAQKNFMDSLAAYSLVCYLLQIKDRHNGNILLDAHGHLIHIDFGFLLTQSPGGINFESAPFKLTQEYVELMGGLYSPTFLYFKMQLTKGFMELRKHVDAISYVLQAMMEDSDLPCFEGFDINIFRERFKETSTDAEAIEHVSRLIESSYDNWKTVQYDNFQKYSNGIFP